MAKVSTVEFRCPSCSKFYRVKKASAGKSAQCTACGTAMQVPDRSEKITRSERWAARPGQHLVAAEAIGGSSEDSFMRGITFLKKSLAMMWDYKASLLPTCLSVLFCIGLVCMFMFAGAPKADDWEPTMMEIAILLFPQYVVFYFCMGMTIRMVFGHLIGEPVSFGQAFAAALVRLPNIIIMAIVGTILDLAVKYAEYRDDLIASIIASIVQAIWTTASFLLMPAMMIDGMTFTQGLKKTGSMFKNNLVPIGVGEIGVRTVTFAVNLVVTLLLVGFLYVTGGAGVVPMIIAFVLWVLAISVFNIYVRTVYYTSLYIWAVSTEEAEQHGGKVWLPAPLADAM